MKTKIYLIGILIGLFGLFWLHGEVLVLHDKLENNVWVQGVKILPDDSDPQEILNGIVESANERPGDNFAILSGVRTVIKQTDTPGTVVWEMDTSQAGQIVLFWNVKGSNDPMDYHATVFETVAEANAFVQDAKASDSDIALWDERPFVIESKAVQVEGESSTAYEIVVP